tara:strand:+ start:469 stop:888 length:420 start_codon:yes stop_codon:yes gene_type:complete
MLLFTNPNGLYSIEYPSSYGVSYEDDILSITPQQGNSCLTISSHHFSDGIDDLKFASLFQKLTLKYEAIQQPLFLSEDIILQRLNNVRPNSEGDVVTTFWTICLYRKGKNMLVISVNVPGEENQSVFGEYEHILNSISL